MKRLLIFSGLLPAMAMLSTSCGDGSDEEGLNVVDTTTVETEPVGDVTVFYQVPTPGEMFDLLQEVGAVGNPSLIQAPGLVDQQLGTKAQATNLGIVVADFAYAASTGMNEETVLNCMHGAIKLCDKLGLGEVFGAETMDRITGNAGNQEELNNMSNDTYFALYAKLEEEGEGNTLALMLTGGWLESMYIATHTVKKYSTDDLIIDRLADQRLTMDNLMKFMEKYEASDENVAAAIQDISPIYDLLYELEEVSVGETQVERVNGKLVVTGGTKIVMNEEQFNSFKEMVTQLRNSYIGTNS